MSAAFVSPQIPTSAAVPPSGSDWIHEIKHDGFRTLFHIDHGDLRAFTRNGYDWSARYAPLVKACRSLPCHTALIDGEVVVQDADGVSDFDALQAAIRHEPHRLVFFAFDLLALNGQDLRRLPLADRRNSLAELLAGYSGAALAFSEHFTGDGQAFFEAAVKHGLEGIVSKQAQSRYRSGPSKHWLKIKNVIESEFILLGLEQDADGCRFAHVGRETQGGIEYAGRAFLTYSERLYGELAAKARTLAMPSGTAEGKRRPQATWVKPVIRVRVRHLRNGNALRHASVRGIV